MNVALPADSLATISLCTGGAGLDLALELAVPSARSVCMVEREAFAVAQLVSAMEAGHLPPAAIWSDVRTFDGRPWRGLVDGIIGGIPCQPHSLAGRKRGQLDGRDLWSDARRIVATARPWFVLIENVSGMLSAGDDEVAGAERVWRDLRKLGYAVEGGLFSAAEVGASHERERVFILGVADSRLTRLEGVAEQALLGTRRRYEGGGASGIRGAHVVHTERAERRQDIIRRDKSNGNYAGWDQEAGRTREPSEAMADADIAEFRRQPPTGQLAVDEHHARVGIFPPGPNDISGWRIALERAPELEPAFRRVADGLASRMDVARVDRLRLLGNGVVPLEGAYAIRTLATRLAKRGAAGADELVRRMT